jgi:hypothetical protein
MTDLKISGINFRIKDKRKNVHFDLKNPDKDTVKQIMKKYFG